MGLIAKTYDLSAVVCTLGPVSIGGYGEEGGLEFEQGAPIGEVTVGATGLATFSRSNNKDMIVTITVMETALSYNLLGQQMKVQENTPFVIVPLPFFMRDFITGEQIAAASAFYLERPTITKGRTVGERAFRVYLPGAATSALYAPQNL